jgi:hypothetical protein
MDASAPAPPATAPVAGVPCTIVQRNADTPRSAAGLLEQARGFQVALAMLGECPFEPEDDVMIACGELGQRVAALARFKHLAGSTAVFMRLSPWRAVDTRSYVRYRTNARANIRRKSGNIHGTVVDISLGGLALEVEHVPGGASLEVRVGTRHGAPYLPCRVIRQREHDGHTVLHVAFERLEAQSQLYVERLIAELCNALEPALLAS